MLEENNQAPCSGPVVLQVFVNSTCYYEVITTIVRTTRQESCNHRVLVGCYGSM